jgi:alkylation response protein AidB-like acyl-CoA dehydrogenase
MNLDDTPSQAEFRARARAWLAEHQHQSPPPVRGRHVDNPAPYRAWQDKLARARLVGVTWPVAYGGGGLGPSEEMIAAAEIARAGCYGEEGWCQLFSEPAMPATRGRCGPRSSRSRPLLGGVTEAGDRVAEEIIERARPKETV